MKRAEISVPNLSPASILILILREKMRCEHMKAVLIKCRGGGIQHLLVRLNHAPRAHESRVRESRRCGGAGLCCGFNVRTSDDHCRFGQDSSQDRKARRVSLHRAVAYAATGLLVHQGKKKILIRNAIWVRCVEDKPAVIS